MCSFCGILRAASSLLKRFFFACVVTWELLGNIRSEELEGYIISRVQRERQSLQFALVQRFHWLVRLKFHVSGGRFRHISQITSIEFTTVTEVI